MLWLWLWTLFQVLITGTLIAVTITWYMYSNDSYWLHRSGPPVPFVKPGEIGSIWARALLLIPIHEFDAIIYKKLRSFQLQQPDTHMNMKYGGYMEYRRPVAFLMDPELIKAVMVKDFDNFVNRRGLELNENDPTLFHKMLFNVEGRKWRDLRSALTPAFSTGKIRKIFAIMSGSADRMIKYAVQEAEAETNPEHELDMGDICDRFTMDVVASAAFGVDSNSFADKNSAFARMARAFSGQFDGLGGLKLLMAIWFPVVFRFFRFQLLDMNAVTFFGGVTKATVDHRIKTGARRDDFLQLLLDARAGQLVDDDDEGDIDERPDETTSSKLSKPRKYKSSSVELTDDQILAQSLMFFLGGSSEVLMQFTLYELAVNPEIQERLASELAMAVETEEGLNYDTINSLPYLNMVTSETLRMYPPTTRAERRCLADYAVLGSAPIEKGTVVVIPIMQLHHDPKYYPNPTVFDPERFNAENTAKRNPYTYLPFGVGPRTCIARRFAFTEAKCALAHLVHNFVISPSAKTQIPMELKWNLTIKPKCAMWLKLSPRSHAL